MKLNQLLLGGLATLALAATSQADNHAGSLVVFPEFNNQVGVHQVLTITNIHSTDGVLLEIVYIDGEHCREFNRNIELTALDTFSFLTKAHNPEQVRGYAYVFAKDAATGDPINFDYLIGSSVAISNFQPAYSINPYTFQGVGEEGDSTELNGNGLRDLDGVEYSTSPDRLMAPRFWGQNTLFQSKLTLIGLTGGARFATTIDFLIYNDNEEIFSTEYTFHCWTQVFLGDISDLFSSAFLANMTNHALDELYGAPAHELGWFEMQGVVASSVSTSIADPSVLMVLREGLYLSQGADLPFVEGQRTTGSLLARSLDGTY